MDRWTDGPNDRWTAQRARAREGVRTRVGLGVGSLVFGWTKVRRALRALRAFIHSFIHSLDWIGFAVGRDGDCGARDAWWWWFCASRVRVRGGGDDGDDGGASGGVDGDVRDGAGGERAEVWVGVSTDDDDDDDVDDVIGRRGTTTGGVRGGR